MKKPDMFLIICDTAFAVILSLLALTALFIAILFKRPDQLVLLLICLLLIWALVDEIRKEIAKNKD
jgi:hypothetical protein